LTEEKSISFLIFSLWQGQEKTLEMVTLSQGSEFPGSGDEEQAHRPHPSYRLHLCSASTGVEMFDILLSEEMQDPRNARYKIDAEKCAQIAQSLWLGVLPS